MSLNYPLTLLAHTEKSSGVPYLIQNTSSDPWSPHQEPASPPQKTGSPDETCVPLTPSYPSEWWYESIAHNGQSSYLVSEYKDNYSVFRNVVTGFGADNTGGRDAAPAIQNAINGKRLRTGIHVKHANGMGCEAGASNGPDRTAHEMGTTGQPAMVYIPSGTYLLKSSLQLYLGTVLVGDPINPPILKAAADFPNPHVVYGKDPNTGGTTNFYIGVKNLVLDSTSVPANQSIALLDWTVSQGTQLANVVFNMPDYSTGHVGVTSQFGYNSNIILNDLTFNGGAFGLMMPGQQWILKNIRTSGTKVGIYAAAYNVVCLACSFEYGETGIDATGISGSLVVIDSSARGIGAMVTGKRSHGADHSMILENIFHDGTTVELDGKVALSGGVANTWVYGNYVSMRTLDPGIF